LEELNSFISTSITTDGSAILRVTVKYPFNISLKGKDAIMGDEIIWG
jgi:hypothetical protein